jgi:N-acetylglucosamine-6-phosphate deacetylase
LRPEADANLVVLDRDLQVASIMADGEWSAER